ncbi:MAG: phosphatase [Desulfovibrionaceae bacterium]|nr:phosphatase [Desulfovibrionaceae bacterium]MBF0513762.1 phosphatase [Desulfovibrionaceae bacterium]
MDSGGSPLTIIYDQHEGETLPCHFRVCTRPYAFEHPSPPSRKGLDTLFVSGSEQPSVRDLIENVRPLAQKIILVDLRQESHGFINDIPVSWYGQKNWANLGFDAARSMGDEEARLAALPGKTIAVTRAVTKDAQGRIDQRRTDELTVEAVATEREAAARAGLAYVRFAVPDHRAPSQEEAARFVDFFNASPADAWFHIHCHGGEGRTTTFMLLCDILRNGRDLSLDDLVLRQHLVGGVDLFNHPAAGYKQPFYRQRAQCIREFYARYAGG